MRPRRWPPWAVVVAFALVGGCYSGLTDAEPDAADDGGTEGDSGGSGGQPVQCEGEVLDPGPNLARRLTVFEYVNTVRAVVGVDVGAEAEASLPPDLRADGFTNTSSGLITTLEHIEAYESLAELAVSKIPDPHSFVAEHTECTDFGEPCESEYVRNLGLVAFRRPPTDTEVASLVEIFRIAEDEGESFEVGAGLVLEAMLQSPAFLYRLEDETSGNQSRELDSWEMASRLSYLVWSAPPDAELLEAAASDALRSDDAIVAEVDRMLADPRAKNASLHFVGDWLHLTRLEHLTRNPERFPQWSSEIGQAMRDETLRFFESVAWDQDRAIVELFDAQETWLTPELATYYGYEPSVAGMQKYDTAEIPERGGLLTQGSLLTIGGDDASMVARGLFVLETILCGSLGSPPPGVDTTPPELEPGKSQRDYSEERTSNDSCAGCHRQMEPLVWGLERYVADGTYRTEDWFGNELREDGFLRFPGDPDDYPYDSSAEMMALLASSDRVRECLAMKGTQFAIGRPLAQNDNCSLDVTQASLAETPGTWRDLLVSIALSPGFRSIRVEE